MTGYIWKVLFSKCMVCLFSSSTQIVSPYDDGIPGNPVGSLQVGFFTYFFYVCIFMCSLIHVCFYRLLLTSRNLINLPVNMRPLSTIELSCSLLNAPGAVHGAALAPPNLRAHFRGGLPPWENLLHRLHHWQHQRDRCVSGYDAEGKGYGRVSLFLIICCFSNYNREIGTERKGYEGPASA